MKKFFAVVILLLACLSYYFYTTRSENQGFVLAASFNCKEGFPFMAEFPDDNTVKITYNTTASYNKTFVGTLPRTAGDGKRFENKDIAYIFAGEEATVITKADNKAVVCTQPFDANNAPVNFGDAGEGGGTRQDVGLVVSESIVGKWQSATDKNFVREFRPDGKVINTENGKSAGLMQGTWKVFTKEQPLEVSFPLESDAVYLQIILVGAQDGETQNFKVGKLTPESLELTDVVRKEISSFVSIK